MLRHFFLVCWLACITPLAWPIGNFGNLWTPAPQFLDVEKVFTLAPVARDGDYWTVQGKIAPNYYVYRHSLRLVDAAENSLDLSLPAGLPKEDEFFGKTEIFQGDGLRLRFPAGVTGPLTLHWQGCAEAGICYPPHTQKIILPAVVAAPDTPSEKSVLQENFTKQAETVNPPLAQDQATAARLAKLGPFAGTVLFFVFGLLLTFTPCVLPMLPIVSTIIVGSHARPRRALLLSFVYVLTMAVTYALLGMVAGAMGANIQASLQSPWLLSAFALIFVLLAASLFGAFTLTLPAGFLQRVQGAGRGKSGSILGAGFLGFLSALLVGPCMTAPLAGALLYIGQTGSALRGGLALFALGLGMGLPVLAIAVFGARILPKPGPWMERVRLAFAYICLAMAVWMLARFLPQTSSLLLWGAWLLSLALACFALAKSVISVRLAWASRFFAAFSGLWAVAMILGAFAGSQDVLQPLAVFTPATVSPSIKKPAYLPAKSIADVAAHLATAQNANQWTLIDFYADWCVSCHIIERTVFAHSAVAPRLAKMQIIRPDVTRNDALDQALLKHWKVLGPPTLILVGPDGKERRAQRTVGEISAMTFIQQLDAAGAP